MEIRPFTESEVAELRGLMAHWGAEEGEIPTAADLLRQIHHCRERVFGDVFLAYKDSGQLIAYLQMIEYSLVGFEPAAEIAAILVHTDFRGCGIGTELIEFSRKWAQNRGLSRLLLSSQLHRTRAHTFYERCGFVKWKESAFFMRTP